jgi:hypothetical protein
MSAKAAFDKVAERAEMISREVAEIFERIGTTVETWQAWLEKLRPEHWRDEG